jgi:hypothetical protein
VAIPTGEPVPCNEEGPFTQVKYYYSFTGSTTIVRGDLLFDDMYGFNFAADGDYRTPDSALHQENRALDTPTPCAPITGPTGFLSHASVLMPESACEAPFNVTYYNSEINGTDGNPAAGDLIFIDPAYTTYLVSGLRPAGAYKYSTGYIVVDESSVVTEVSLSCPSFLTAFLSSPVAATANDAYNLSPLTSMFFDGDGDTPAIGDKVYLDSFGEQPLASFQGAGYIYLSDTSEVAYIDINSIIQSLIPI